MSSRTLAVWKWFPLPAVILLSTLCAAQSQPSQPQTVTANVDITRTMPPVSKYEFGMFIEPIGPLIYRSLWSEMLDDRKFISQSHPRKSLHPTTLLTTADLIPYDVQRIAHALWDYAELADKQNLRVDDAKAVINTLGPAKMLP